MSAQGQEIELRPLEACSDEQIVGLVRQGRIEAYELLMRRCNRRIFRAARAILGNADESEDVMQHAYVRAYTHLAQFAGEAKFSTWVTRIAIHEALARRRIQRRWQSMDTELLPNEPELMLSVSSLNPEDQMTQTELRTALEAAIDALPDGYREVFVLRCVEELSAAETAECLEITADAAKMRLHRARVMLRQFLFDQSGLTLTDLFAFHLTRCDRVVRRALERILPSH